MIGTVRRVAGRSRPLLSQGLRFLGAGGLATACHYALLTALVELASLPPVPASSIGYAAAAALNYFLRRCFVFRSRSRHRRTIPRYLAVALTGLSLNTAVMALGVDLLALPYVAVQVIATGMVVVWNFTAHRLWTFRDEESDPFPPEDRGERAGPDPETTALDRRRRFVEA